jgi:hypothetical protein
MLRMNHKPNYDLFICDKSKRIEEIWKFGLMERSMSYTLDI